MLIKFPKPASDVVTVIALNLVAVAVVAILIWQTGWVVAEINTASARLAEARRQQQELSGLKEQAAETAIERAVVNSYFVGEASLPAIIEKLESLAVASSIKFELSGANTDAKQNAVVKLDFQSDGSFGRSLHFLTLVENLPYQLRLEHYNLERTKTASSTIWHGVGRLELSSLTK